mmetsp:Transcript_75941/g.180572  ORF Transcript_75941/g.180572 Transcript_75941/m.180572 type:complete len:215 (+) Transcript_75941:180-824(+)
MNCCGVMIPWPSSSTSLNIASTLTLLKDPLKKALACSGVTRSVLSGSILLKSSSHFFQVLRESLLKNGLRGKGFNDGRAAFLESCQSTHAPPWMSSSSSSNMSCSLYPDFRTCTQKSMNSCAVMAPLPSTSTSLKNASALNLPKAPLKKACASCFVTALLPSTSIKWKHSSIFCHALAESLHIIGRVGNGAPQAVILLCRPLLVMLGLFRMGML